METPGFIVVTRIPDVIVPECVSRCASVVSNMACVHGNGRRTDPDGCGEPSVPYKVILATAPGSQDVACEARSAFCERPSRARLCGGNPVWKRSTFGTRRPRRRLKCRWRVLYEFGTDGSTCGRMCEAPRAACRVFCSRNARSGSTGRYARAGLHGKPCSFGVRVTSPGTSRRERRSRDARSGFLGRCARAGLHGKPRRFGAQVMSPGTSWREFRASGVRWLAWRTPRRRALVVMRRATKRPQVSSNGRDERACRRPPPWRCKKKKASLQVHGPGQDVVDILLGHSSTS